MRMVPSLKLASARKNDGMFLNISDSELRMSPGPGAYKISSPFDRFKAISIVKKSLMKHFKDKARQNESSFNLYGPETSYADEKLNKRKRKVSSSMETYKS